MARLYTINKKDLLDLLARLSARSSVYIPYKKDSRLYLAPFDVNKMEAIELGEIRQSQPLKTFLTSPRKELTEARGAARSVIVAGVKQCDLASIRLQDFVFMEGDHQDPFYSENRKNLLIISCDCTLARETCFCFAMDGKPYPDKSFDLNLSIAGDRHIVEVGSERGASIVEEFKAFFSGADEGDLKARGENRKRVSAEVESFIKKRGTPSAKDLAGAVMKNYASALWKDFYSTCVECGACNLVCPTCHCFLLYDQKRGATPVRFMTWDACLYNRFARVAGGANPRKHLWERLRNRFEKKFDFFPKVLGLYACTGCGRCIEACPGDIDLREVLKGLVSGKWNKPPND